MSFKSSLNSSPPLLDAWFVRKVVLLERSVPRFVEHPLVLMPYVERASTSPPLSGEEEDNLQFRQIANELRYVHRYVL